MEDKKNTIQVEVRINPRLDNVIESTPSALTVGTKTYTFSKVHLTTSQVQIYDRSVRHLTESFLEGYNCTVMAYGQTGSGKTYTMGMTHEDMTGIVPQSLKHIFKITQEVNCIFIEVYNEEVIDLFSKHKMPLSLREVNGEVTIAGASEVTLKSYEDGIEALKKGSLERTTKSTNMNSKSSRSHAIFTLFHRKEVNGSFITSKFSFVDLAGSERLKRTMCAGDRAKEGISINSGLLALGNVISALFKKSSHIPFRDSKLTRILQSCLNGYVLMVACISSSHADIGETHNTLKYASRAASIETTTKMNIQVDSSKFTTLLLKKEIQKLKAENQILKEKFRRESKVNIEELILENRSLKSKLETLDFEKNDRREDIVQEILKHPFVQNLINENQKLKDTIQRMPREPENRGLITDEYKGLESFKRKASENRINSPENSSRKKRDEEKLKIVAELDEPEASTNNPGDNEYKRQIENQSQREYNKIDTIRKYVDSLEISDTCEIIEDQMTHAASSKTHKRIVSFDLERNTKKYALFTPRKEKITMNTTIVEKLSGYLPTTLALFDSCLVFGSIDNKIRKWSDRTETLFTEEGVRCMEGLETLLYTTRGILKRFDHRSGTRPVYGFRSEVSALLSRDNYIFTGHEDGTLSILDQRNCKLAFAEKAHSGTVFCIERMGQDTYTGSRDHTVKRYNDGFITLSPPHLDSVQGLLCYKNELISFGRDCSLRRWKDGTIVKTVPYAHDSWIKCGASMEDSFVTGSKDGMLRFWDFLDSSMFCVGKMKIVGAINSVIWDGKLIYVGTQSKEILAIRCKYESN
ncbi:kinesin-like protein [Encephalitozoon intestinalis ATCC 50506]|uniref:Kinesin-like protein n=1 Tax=Encephalitozoon intestinalis (strain ATCC 50506) TaxID=876142 RepID=E0S725_ENCIT|nr:kinesin-like protein [Encephalitozoon intestinalis ATCC 50506]ADM11453.1 kinesin-like protein [Encephalitozoon intestinalis ATCC 50506]UTX45162.1 kinesin-like protein [Encephalitozoon intestinalis]